MPPAIKVTRPSSELRQLAADYAHEENWRKKARMAAVLARLEGTPVELTAQVLRVSRKTLTLWVNRFNREGVAGLADRPRKGRPPKLPAHRVDQVLGQHPSAEGLAQEAWTPTLLWHVIRDNYGVAYSRGHVSAIVRRLGYRLIVPRTTSVKASPAAQAQWRATTGAQLLAGHADSLWLEDETTARVSTIVKRVLVKRGTRPVLPTRVGAYSAKVNVFISWRAKSRQVVVSLENSLDSAATKRHLRKLKRVHGLGRAHVLWDGSGAHHAANVKTCCGKAGIHTYFLPPYSPQMNPVEEINRQLKRHLSNKLFASRDAVAEDIKAFFREKGYRFTFDLAAYIGP